MRIPDSFLDEIRARTSLSALVTRTVPLIKAGNEFKACCPFHHEKSPSFYVNDDKGFYHCFGCGAHGDPITWSIEHRGATFLEAVQEPAAAAGLEVPRQHEERRDERQDGLLGVTARAEGWFADQLHGLDGAAARAYLAQRGIGDGIAREFALGLAPDSRSRLRMALRDAGDRQLVEVGLLVERQDGDPYDRFRGRLVFPIHDAKGRTIAFGGRILGQGEPKYINSPETPLFDKGRTLFNLHRAAPAARRAGRMLVVEGYMDVVQLAQAGIDEAVAPLGTAITEAQMERLWRIVPEPVLCFDGDAAGRKASARAAVRALPLLQPGRTLAFALMPNGQDPDDVARRGGASAVNRLVERAAPLVDLLWSHEHDAGPLATPEQRAALRARVIAHARTIPDRPLSFEYEQEFRRRCDEIFPRMRRGERPAPVARAIVDPDGPTRKMVTAVMRGLVRFPMMIAERADQIAMLPIGSDAQREAVEMILRVAYDGEPVDVPAMDALFPDDAGWRGFLFSFMRPATRPDIAASDLGFMIDGVFAATNGATEAELVAIARKHMHADEPQEKALL